MVRVTEELIREMAAVVAREVNPEAIILFGSHATGDARPDSDVDLLVIETAPFGLGRDRRREMTRLWRALGGFAIAKDILVYSHDEVERWRSARNHVIAPGLYRKGDSSMAISDEARQLLAAANKDLRALQGMIDASIFADEIFGFHAQQAVEKAYFQIIYVVLASLFSWWFIWFIRSKQLAKNKKIVTEFRNQLSQALFLID